MLWLRPEIRSDLSVPPGTVRPVTDDIQLRMPIQLDAYSSQPGVPSVVDADALLSSIRNQSVTGWQSRLSQLGESARTPIFASQHVYWEVYRKLPKLAVGSGASIIDLRDCFETDYLPHITWVGVADGYGHDDRVREVTDPTDVPTAHLASLIAPCIVYAEDKSLRRPGFASAGWRDAAGSAVSVVETRAGQEGLILAVGLPAIGTVKGMMALSRRIRLPGWLGSVALIGGIGWLLSTKDRRQVTGRILTPVFEEFIRLTDNQHQALADLEVVVFQPVVPPSAKQMIATVVARTNEPLLVTDIHVEITYRFSGVDVPTLAEVRQILASEPEFRKKSYRWQLGYRAAALSDANFAMLIDVKARTSSTVAPC